MHLVHGSKAKGEQLACICKLSLSLLFRPPAECIFAVRSVLNQLGADCWWWVVLFHLFCNHLVVVDFSVPSVSAMFPSNSPISVLSFSYDW